MDTLTVVLLIMAEKCFCDPMVLYYEYSIFIRLVFIY